MTVEKPFKQPSFMSSQAHFAKTPQADVPRSVFNRSHQYKTTFDAGYLIPIYCDEVLPGDSFKMRCTTFARLATPLYPFMDNVYSDVHFWFVPNRLLWDNWERFNGAQDDPGDSTSFTVPQVASTGAPVVIGSIYDYMGIPLNSSATQPAVNALHYRAYNLIWNNWYRDQNLQNSVQVDTDDGTDAASQYTLLKRGKRHDYFTSALPWPQKGTALSIPMDGVAPVASYWFPNTSHTSGAWATNAAGVKALDFLNFSSGSGNITHALGVPSADVTDPQALNVSKISGNNFDKDDQSFVGPYLADWGDVADTGYLASDLSQATGATINALRQAFQLQRLLERDARGGTRYVEILKAHFGVTSPDFRLQRPEYLGGGTTVLNTSPIAQTSATSTDPMIAEETPQGNLAAMGVFSHSGAGFTKSFVEHGVILGLISVRADMTYQGGLERMWTRQTRYDYYWPALSHLGEQSILAREIYYLGTSNDTIVWGYQERYAEYRYKPSNVTGLFRSDASGSLDAWHLAQDFAGYPVLDATFIQENPPIDRVIAVPSEPHFLLDCVFNLQCARPIPVYSVPGLVDHF